MALAGWQLACHQLHILVPVFISRTLHVLLGQECVPEPLREVPELGIDVAGERVRGSTLWTWQGHSQILGLLVHFCSDQTAR
jgi:hypothetical protein